MRGKSVLSRIFRLNAAAKLTGSVVINGDYLRLLIVEESENDAESLANILRKAGHSIRFDYAREAEMISSDQRDTLKDFLRSFQSGNSEDSTLSISCVNRDHKNFDSTMEFTPASIGGEPCTQIIIRTNNSNNCELDEKIETMMRQDNLTGLSNRQNFMGLLEENINTRDESGDVRALVYITLDGFRKIREETGIAASDIVLCDVARLLEQQCCGKDILSRFGDFSYAILYHAGSDEKIQATGEKLLQDISGHMSEVNGHPITMTCSIGICAINECSNDAQMILTHADTACEVARSSGGNRIHTHSPVIDEQTTGAHEMEWDEVIRNIIEEERFYPAYQPIVSLTGDTSKRYEALLRIIDEEGNTILPGQFLALAEKSGFSSEIDYRVLDTAFRKLHESDGETTIFIKLSKAVLADTNLAEWIQGKLGEYQLASSSVVFEIQEIDAANDLKSAIGFAREMKKLQCKVALGHCGTGEQSQLLQHVAVDILKIGGKLIASLTENQDYQSRGKEFVTLAHENGRQCIAECVDNPATLAILWQCGVDMMQGNFVQEPSRELAYNFEDEIA
jgi:diguanylate cyclase (GGDEF)-like protein